MGFMEDLADFASVSLEATGIIAIMGGALVTFVTAGVLLLRRAETFHVYRTCRGRLGRGILIGREFLVAAGAVI